MQPMAKIPVTIVTGFLGSGKTTLIRHVLENAGGRRLALIINEFGDVGVDGSILKSCGIDSCPEENIVELANGCLCCTVADDFIPAIEALLARVPHDPVKLAAQRAADSSIDHDNPLEEVYEDQLLCADLIVLNKADLMTDETARRVVAEIQATVPRAVKIVETREGRIDPSILLGLGAAAEDDLANRPSHHDGEEGHDHDDFESFVLDIPATSDPAGLLAHLAAVAERHDVLRMKGFIEVAGKPMRLLVQGVGQRFRQQFDRPWGVDEARRSRLVVIGEKGLDRAGIAAALGG